MIPFRDIQPGKFALAIACAFGALGMAWMIVQAGVWFFRHTLLVAAVIFIASEIAAAPPPAIAARIALNDLQRLPPVVQHYTRYLSLSDEADARHDQTVAVAYMLNAVGRSRMIFKPTLLRGTNVLRIDLSLLISDPDSEAELAGIQNTWESIAYTDPYFHIRANVAIEGKKKQAFRDGGWIDPGVAQALRALSKSDGAVLRADFFVARSAQPPFYYDLAGLPATETELLKQLGVNRAQQNELRANTAANVMISKITDKPRRIIHMVGPLGGVYQTQDVAIESPDKDPFRSPINYDGPHGPQFFRADASEWFAAKSNKFFITYLSNANGQRQDAVPDKIAKDAHGRDGIVYPIVSCIRCHELHGGGGGLQPISDEQWALLAGPSALASSYIPAVARRLAELYEPGRMSRSILRDREDYTVAVLNATGVKPADAAASLSRVFFDFVDAPVTLDVAAKEAGLTPAQFVSVMRDSTDTIVLAIRAGSRVRRKAYEPCLQEIYLRAWSAQ